LSYGRLRPPVDDAIKIMGLTTNDGNGILAYAGLGATPKGTQPSEWMSAVLRGRGGLTFDQTLGVLADAATRELPKYLIDVPGGGHFIVAPAFVTGICQSRCDGQLMTGRVSCSSGGLGTGHFP
jgi:hypothetical protein